MTKIASREYGKTFFVCTFSALLFAGALLTPVSVNAVETLQPHHLVGHEELELLDQVQDLIDDWDPRKLENPLVVRSQSRNETNKLVDQKQLRRSDLAQFIADISAAEALGKAFFWEMQAGSDFRRTSDGMYVGTACASCHYRHGADARSRHTQRIPYAAWDQYPIDPDHPLNPQATARPYSPATQAATRFDFNGQRGHGSPYTIVGSQGVEPRWFTGLNRTLPASGPWQSENSRPRSIEGFQYRPQWSMFIEGDYTRNDDNSLSLQEKRRYRQITTRNSPSVINSVFADRLFHDGRAESTFNGFSIFGDADKREVIHRRRTTQILDEKGNVERTVVDIIPVHIAITNAALASQAVGPVVNDVEMSYLGRAFPNLAAKLLPARVLGYQDVNPHDSALTGFNAGRQGTTTYESLIRQAFRREWWDDSGVQAPVRLTLLSESEKDGEPTGTLMEANFSLYWGLSIMLYEATLVSDQTPFDDMMRGRTRKVEERWRDIQNGNRPDDGLRPIHLDRSGPNPPEHSTGSAVFQHGFRVFMNRGCIECHSGPLFSELYDRLPEDAKFPIQADVQRTLLPNSRADSYKLNLRPAREKLMSDLRQICITANPGWKPQAPAMSLELDALRQRGHGVCELLKAEAYLYFRQAGLDDESSKRFGDQAGMALFKYERSEVNHLGNRLYFRELERITMVEQIVQPVLVEKMPIPPRLLRLRPKLPYPLDPDELVTTDEEEGETTAGYAFYDLGFYNLGVTPPRFDRGVGARTGEMLELTEQVTNAIQVLAGSGQKEERAVAAAADHAIRSRAVSDLSKGAPQKYLEELAKEINKQPTLQDEQKKAIVNRMIDALEKQRTAVNSPLHSQSNSAPGNAYRFKSNWARPRLSRDTKAAQQAQPPAAPPSLRNRTSHDGPQLTMESEAMDRFIDTSWDRIDLPDGTATNTTFTARRSEQYFFSRARRMVYDESYWGYRKPFTHDNELAFWGAFKTPSLRNVELTAPYMHNGRLMTLTDVVDFYADRARQLPPDLETNPDKHPEINGFALNEDDRKALVFFLICLTDERVRREEAPFDHPSLLLVNGYKTGAMGLEDNIIPIPEVGPQGRLPSSSVYFPSEE